MGEGKALASGVLKPRLCCDFAQTQTRGWRVLLRDVDFACCAVGTFCNVEAACRICHLAAAQVVVCHDRCLAAAGLDGLDTAAGLHEVGEGARSNGCHWGEVVADAGHAPNVAEIAGSGAVVDVGSTEIPYLAVARAVVDEVEWRVELAVVVGVGVG